MNQFAPYIIGFLVGLLTGVFYFGGLWLTVKKVPNSKQPNRLLLLSSAARLLPTLAVMFILIKNDPGMFVFMLIAFFLVRFFMTRKIAPRNQPVEDN